MEEAKIFIANYPNNLSNLTFVREDNENIKLKVYCGYETQLKGREASLQIARDLITSLLTFDYIYIQGSNVWDIMQVFGREYTKELLRDRILRILPDQDLNPALLKENDGDWVCDFFSYPIGNAFTHPSKKDSNMWEHIEYCFFKNGFKGKDANTILT